MSVFLRRFTSDPGNEVLLDIESIDILDLAPPGAINGVGTGTALIVGEFENGPFETTEEVSSSTDLAQRYGGFGYSYGGITGNNPSARSRKADGALNPEFWNGNAAVQLNGKKFRRLLVTRVDTSVGEVEFERFASLSGSTNQTFNLNPGDTYTYVYGDAVSFATGGGTFLAVEAILLSAAGVYPSLFVGGETLTLTIDAGTPRQVGPIVVHFTATDQTQAQVIARINAAIGYTCAVDTGGGTTTFTGRVQGTSGNVTIIASTFTATDPLTVLGIVVGSTTGTGNVGDITAVTIGEVNNVAATPGAIEFDRDNSGALRVHSVDEDQLFLLSANLSSFTPNAVGLGFDFGPTPPPTALGTGPESSQPDGFARFVFSGTYPTLFVGGETLILGVDGEPDVTVTFTALDQTAAQVAARINAAMGFTFMVDNAGFETFTARANGGQIRVLGGSATALHAIFTVTPAQIPFSVQALVNANITIPAGTRIQNAAQTITWVTMQDIPVRGSGTDSLTGDLASGPYSVKVRPGKDDGTIAGTGTATVTVIPFAIDTLFYTVNNPTPLTAALTEGQIDAAYFDAIGVTVSVDTVARDTNLIWSARQSNAVRNTLRQNANDSSANGCFGRMAFVRPPLGTTRLLARSATQPGVGAYRDQRVVYTFPGVQTFVPGIAARGTGGGDGFTANGIINVGSDGFLASICSQLAPEENPGQATGFAIAALGLETNNPDVQDMGINDYKTFRANGIAAPRMDLGVLIFQSGITSVNPAVQPQFRNIARRRMADFIQDSLSVRLKDFGKKLSTQSRRAAIISEIRSFMNTLLSPGNPAAQRIDGFKVDPIAGNTPDTLALGIFRVILLVRTLASLDAIVLQTTVGELVDVSEAA